MSCSHQGFPSPATGGLVLALLLGPATAIAAEWYAEPSLSVGLTYTDNLYLNTVDPQSTTGTIIAPQLNLGVRETNWFTDTSARLRDVNYSGDFEPDRQEQYYNVLSGYNLQRSQFGFKGYYRVDPLRADGIIDPDLGVPLRQTDRMSYNVAPTASYALTELTKLQAAYQYTDVRYDQGIQVRLFDYTDQNASAALISQLDPRNQLSLILGYSKYEVPDVRRLMKTASYQLGIAHTMSETTRVSLSGGSRRTVTDDVVRQCAFFVPIIGCLLVVDEQVSSRKSGYLFNASLEHALDRTRLKVELGRSVQPSGSATQVESDFVTFGLSHSPNQRLTLDLAANGYNYSAIETGTSEIDRRVYQLSSALRWRWTENLSVDSGYTYTEQKFDSREATAHSNAVYLSLRYQWQYWRVSE